MSVSFLLIRMQAQAFPQRVPLPTWVGQAPDTVRDVSTPVQAFRVCIAHLQITTYKGYLEEEKAGDVSAHAEMGGQSKKEQATQGTGTPVAGDTLVFLWPASPLALC